MLHIQCTKVYVYRAQLPIDYVRQIRLGNKTTDATTIYRYPKNGFDLGDAKQRKDLYTTLFDVFRYSTSGQVRVGSQSENSTEQVKVRHGLYNLKFQDVPTKEVIVINGPVSEGDRFLNSLQFLSLASPKRKSPRRSPSPKRPTSPKRKHNPDGDAVNESPRPTKRTATAETKSSESQKVKVNTICEESDNNS